MPPVLYEDNHFIAVNKRPGDIVQPDKSGDPSLEQVVKEYIRRKYDKPGEAFLGVVHRIDRPVSGVVVFARTGKALERMNAMFQNKEIRKTYWAVVKNMPNQPEATLIHYLVRNEQKNLVKAYPKEIPGSKRSELHYRMIASSDRYHLLEIDPKTGRHHQIRVQLGAMGFPIRGDVKYGFDRTNKDGSIHLHAREIRFIHPVKKEELAITADPPDDPLWNSFVGKVVSD